MRNTDAVLYHGYVKAPLSKEPRFAHGWVVHNGIVKDWQTMVAGFGGRFMGIGYPERVWRELWKPQHVISFTAEQAYSKAVREQHYGPWGALDSWMQRVEEGR